MSKKVKTSSEYQFYPFADIRDITKVRRLSEKQEITLSKQVQEMIILTENGQLKEKINEFTQQQKRAIEVGKKAKERMMKANSKLVISVAKNYQSKDFDLIDLVQEGFLGLERAVESYDFTRGYRFETYAFHWIRGSLRKKLNLQKVEKDQPSIFSRLRAIFDIEHREHLVYDVFEGEKELYAINSASTKTKHSKLKKGAKVKKNSPSMSEKAAVTKKINALKKDSETLVLKPRSFDELPQLISPLRDRKTIILNSILLNDVEAQRAIDFAAGAALLINGHKEKIDKYIYRFTPSNEIVKIINS